MEVNSREELEECTEEEREAGEGGSVDGAPANASGSSQGPTPPKDDPILEEFHDWKVKKNKKLYSGFFGYLSQFVYSTVI